MSRWRARLWSNNGALVPLLACALLISPVVLSAATAAALPAERADAERAAALATEGTNAFRRREGLAALKPDARLAQAAQRFAEYMASTDQYGHQADGRQPAERARAHGYAYCTIAENIAYQFHSRGFATEELAARLVEGWEQSPGHRRNMLLPGVTEIGTGVARSERSGRFYAVQLFGRPQSASTRFDIANRSDAAIRYELDGTAYELPPRVTRTHEGCFAGDLRVQWPNGAGSRAVEPRDGARYAVLRDPSGHLRLQVN